MKIAHYIDKVASEEIDFGDGDVLHYTFRPAAITGRMGTLADNMKTQADLDEFYAAFCTVIQSWDLEDDVGAIDLTPDAVARVPITLLAKVFVDGVSKAGEAVAARLTINTPSPVTS